MFRATLSFLFCTAALVFPAGVQAYMGPTLGLGVVGTVITIVAVLLLSLFSFVWVPLRRLLRKMKHKTADESSDS